MKRYGYSVFCFLLILVLCVGVSTLYGRKEFTVLVSHEATSFQLSSSEGASHNNNSSMISSDSSQENPSSRPPTTSNDSNDLYTEDVLPDISISAYTIYPNADGREIALPVYDENRNVVLAVAENITLEQFLCCVVPTENHFIKVVDANGDEVTAVNIKMASGMKFKVFQNGADAPAVVLPIQVVNKH